MAQTVGSSPDQVLEYYEDMIESLRALRREVVRGDARLDSLRGLTEGELDARLAERRAELDLQVTLALTAGYEAAIRLDFLARASRKTKGRLGIAMRRLHKKYDGRVSLELILDAWSDHVGRKQVFGNFKQLYRYRHWLAHGRHWAQRSGIAPSPEQAMAIGDAVLDAIT